MSEQKLIGITKAVNDLANRARGGQLKFQMIFREEQLQ